MFQRSPAMSHCGAVPFPKLQEQSSPENIDQGEYDVVPQLIQVD
jgi:hypothetical protein